MTHKMDIEAIIQVKSANITSDVEKAENILEENIKLKDYNIMKNTVQCNTNTDTDSTLISVTITFPLTTDTKQNYERKSKEKLQNAIDNLDGISVKPLNP